MTLGIWAVLFLFLILALGILSGVALDAVIVWRAQGHDEPLLTAPPSPSRSKQRTTT